MTARWCFAAICVAFGSSAVAQTASVSGSTEAQAAEVHRILGIVPVVDAPLRSDAVAPLSRRQKFKLFAETTIDPASVLIAAVGAGITVPCNAQPSYGTGWAAFGERTGAVAADLTSDQFFTRAVLPSIFHQDPRYFRKADGNAVSRVFYAIGRTFVTRNDRGHDTVNTSYLAGYAMSMALSNAYYPDRNRNARDTVSRYAEGVVINMAINVIREFRKH